ncbi:MAG: thioredoxin domain-containing protein [SAR202 cluster bacterium]|nr:thioredoxin domain-containing protein [SAR202 cluster bacterium]
MLNRLINETSPYLLQHANNPVDWYPWDPEAFEKARAEDKPILLSVGYSACHWCHVMEHESFENRDIAKLMNDNFVSIKVDREERPDVDSIYMSAVQAMTGRGGWPMTVFMTPDGKPFYGGTYFPPEDRRGMPGFPRVLQALAEVYRENRGEILKTSGQLMQHMRQMDITSSSRDPLTDSILNQAFSGLAKDFDDNYGGFGYQPKFPQPMTYEFLLRHYARTGSPTAREMVDTTLDHMAMGGIYDQLGGGFHRYSVDMYWLVPHFEKMLYDNALLVRLYLHAYQVTGKPLYRRVVEETLEYMQREMVSPEGGFYSAQDADSEGEEGRFFLWRPDQVRGLLGEEDGDLVNDYYGVTPQGNFEGRNILSVAVDPEAYARSRDMAPKAFQELLDGLRRRLLEERSKRIAPARDDKVLTSWNGLAITAFAEAALVLGRPEYAVVADRAATFVMDNLRQDGRLLRTFKDGQAKYKGYLEDYSFLASALLQLHEASFDRRWLDDAIGLCRQMVELFWDAGAEKFYDTGADHEALVLRPHDISDNAIPAGSSMAADVLLRLAVITGDADLREKAAAALRGVRELMSRAPSGAGHWLCALDFYLSTPKEIAIVGEPGAPDTMALLAEVHNMYLPNRVLIGSDGGPVGAVELPLLESRTMVGGKATAYVCEHYVCQLPATDPQALAAQLGGD